MRKLIVLRHAKSSWSNPALADHDRPLNQRGRMAATMMGVYLADQGLRPDHVIMSSSARTVETWARVSDAFETPPDSEVREELYLADPQTMLYLARALPDEARTALLLTHNPGAQSFTRRLSGGPPDAACARAFQKFPTAAVAVFEAVIEDWSDLEFGAARFVEFTTPKDLV